MLSGNNGILNRATQAKDATRGAEVQEMVRLEATNNTASEYIGGGKKSRAQVIKELSEQGKLTPEEVRQLTDKDNPVDVLTIGGITTDFSVLDSAKSKTLGEVYDENEGSMIGKIINYKSEKNDDTEWIIFGKQTTEGKNGIIITTKNPVGIQHIDVTIAEWVEYETTIKNACKDYVGETGTLGEKDAQIVEVRSITIEDINNAVGFVVPEIFDEVVFGQDNDFAYPKEDGTGWIKKTDSNYLDTPVSKRTYLNNAYNYYKNGETYTYASSKNGWIATELSLENNLKKLENMNYVAANDEDYWIASRSIDVYSTSVGFCVAEVHGSNVGSTRLCSSDARGGYDGYGGGSWLAFRPVVVLSSEILWDDVKDLIDENAQY